MPAALAGYRESLSLAMDGGWRPPARQIKNAVDQAQNFGGRKGFFAALPTSAPDFARTGTLATELAAGAEAAGAAYLEVASWLTEEAMPRSRSDDAVGRGAYALHSRSFLGTVVDLDETYTWGLEELARIEQRMADLARQITPQAVGSTTDVIQTACDHLDADPNRRIHGADAFRDWMQAHSDHALDALGRTHFDIPEPVRTLVCRIAPSSSGSVYYTPPSEDFSRPGQMWWSVPTGVASFATWHETSTVYHEGVPGHHLQCGIALAESATLNRWRRLFAWTSGHGEGWALYAERLMEELGFLDDPGDLMGMLDAHALRAARVVVDIGVHCGLSAPAEVGGGIWDATKAWTFLRRHTRVNDPSLRFELDRYLGWPGQAPSYKIGERIWLQLREDARSAAVGAGQSFDLKEFHTRALRIGSVGLDVLRSAVLRGAGTANTDAAPGESGSGSPSAGNS
jgi:uncharacterized protein (DUF885 family)